jgi:hypothetical protein
MAKVIDKTMHYLNNMIHSTKKDGSYLFVVTYTLNKGLKEFGKKGYDAAFGEMKQLHDCIVFQPVNVNDLSLIECKRQLESLIFLVEKRDGRVKGRACANGSTQRGYINKEDSSSPTATTKSIVITQKKIMMSCWQTFPTRLFKLIWRKLEREGYYENLWCPS